MKVGYLSHPLSAPTLAEQFANAARARRWYLWLWQTYPGVVAICPWLVDAEVLPLDDADPKQREQSLERDLLVLAKLDVLFLCGGRLSPGMNLELATAQNFGLEVIDLLYLGAEPPAGRIA